MTVLIAPRLGPAVGRRVGTAAGSALALALLACACVFTALAGPALSLHTRTQALQQTLAGLPGTTKTVQVNSAWSDFLGSVPGAQALNQDMVSQATDQIGLGLAAAPVPLAGGQWTALTTKPLLVTAGAAPSAIDEAPPKLEVSYRTPSTGHMQLVKGSFSTTPPPGTVAVAATVPTAARFGMHPGSRLALATPNGPETIFVTAIIRTRDLGSTFWQQDSSLIRPSLNQDKPPSSPLYWFGGVIADPSQLGPVQTVFGNSGLNIEWEYPLGLTNVNADQAQGLYQALNRATTASPPLTGRLAPAGGGAGGQLAAAAGPGGVPQHPGGRGNRALAAVRQPDRDRRGGDPARRPDDRRAP